MKGDMLSSALALVLSVAIMTSGCATNAGVQENSAPIVSQTAQLLRVPGKIYVKGNLLFVNELAEGIHVIDNANPSQPELIGFIVIPGNVDIAIRGNVLYADSQNDLVAIDIADPTNASEITRIEDMFSEESEMPLFGKIVLGILLFPLLLLAAGGSSGEPSEAAEASSSGEGGSLARFAIVGDYLYVLSGSALQLIDITNPTEPQVGKKIEVGWDIETIFPYEDNLFIGGRNGMYIFDNTDPAHPKRISEFLHLTSCDPVVVEGDTAYVTLRAGTDCGGRANLLEIIDISFIFNPRLLVEYPMREPYGLGVEGDSLFICDGAAGLKLYDISDPHDLSLIDTYNGVYPLDVILTDKSVVVTGKDGLYQFSYQSRGKIVPLSRIPVGENTRNMP
jgi:hypothetical protein